MEISLMKILAEHGLGACLAIAIFVMMFWLLKNIIKDQREERKSYHTMITTHVAHNTQALNGIMEKSKTQTTLMGDVFIKIKDEHSEILRALRNFNGKNN